MRRRSNGVRQANALFGPDLEGALSVDPELAVRVLEPLVTEERRARLRRVVGDRLDSVTVLMDAPHDPHNGGAVVRSCDAFGVQRLHVVERKEPFLVATTVARGSERWVDVLRYKTSEEAAAELRKGGYEFIATDPDGELWPEHLRRIERPALVIGNERQGI